MDKMVDIIFRNASKKEKSLNNLFKREKKKVVQLNNDNGLGNYSFFSDCCNYETDDMFTEPQKIEENGVCVWLSNSWVNSNKMPNGVEIRDNRFPVKCVSLWYTPYKYMATSIDIEELYNKSETEKVLYEDIDVKISMVRRNIIPFFKSYQYCHKISKHEYVLYLKRRKADKIIDEQIQCLKDKLKTLKCHNQEELEILNEIRGLNNKLYYWHECFHADSLKHLKIKAEYYFNDWYK